MSKLSECLCAALPTSSPTSTCVSLADPVLSLPKSSYSSRLLSSRRRRLPFPLPAIGFESCEGRPLGRASNDPAWFAPSHRQPTLRGPALPDTQFKRTAILSTWARLHLPRARQTLRPIGLLRPQRTRRIVYDAVNVQRPSIIPLLREASIAAELWTPLSTTPMD